MERLTAIAPNGMAYLVKVKPNEQAVESPYPNTLKCIMESFQKLSEYEIAEKQGLLHKALIPDGTPIFVIHNEECEEFFGEDFEPIGETSYIYGYIEFVYGDRWYLTREAAEEALKEAKEQVN